MLEWKITPTQDDAIGLTSLAEEITTLVSSIRLALIEASKFEIIWELCSSDESVGRANIQFLINADLFDLIFNSSVGYRGFFRRGLWLGCTVNSLIISEIKSELTQRLTDLVSAHILKPGPALCGKTRLEKAIFLRSLDPSLSKLWYSTILVTPEGSLSLLALGTSNEKINVGLQTPWMKIEQEPNNCLVEIKGAFVGKDGLFQFKDPYLRALTLSQHGEA